MRLRAVVVVAAFVLAGATPATARPVPDQCVPADLRDHAISFRADDHVELSGLVLGSGSSGVLLASGAGATTVAARAERISGPKGLVLLSPFAVARQGTELDAVADSTPETVPR